MAGRKIRDEADALSCWAAAQRAGGDVGGWARAHGVDGRSLNAWRVNLGLGARHERNAITARPQLVELVPKPSSTGGRYVVRIADAAVELDDAFREDTLARIVRVLRAC